MVEKMIKTFRGLLADNEQARIRLSTIKGKVGYKIVKFQIMPKNVGTADVEAVMQLFKSEQASVPTAVEFTDSNLLGAAYMSLRDNSFFNTAIIFDTEVFNQDIFVTYHDASTGQSCNYYFELEIIPLDDKGAEYTTIRDLRTRGF